MSFYDTESPIQTRDPGRPKVFVGEKLLELAEFMEADHTGQRPTTQQAADHFNCSRSLIEKTIAAVRRAAKVKTPLSTTDHGA